jgi:hypothetical protein
MIEFNFEIENPYYSANDFKNIWDKSGQLTENKAWELQLYKNSDCIVGLGFRFSFRGRDHAGLQINLGLLGYRFDMMVYDIRHWNHAIDSWEVYP